MNFDEFLHDNMFQPEKEPTNSGNKTADIRVSLWNNLSGVSAVSEPRLLAVSVVIFSLSLS